MKEPIFKIPHYPNKLVACKRGSPLLLGIKELTEDRNGDCCLFIVTLVVMKRAFKITEIPPDQPAKCYTFIGEVICHWEITATFQSQLDIAEI